MKKEKFVPGIKCECGYQNKEFNVRTYGTCTRCGKVLDSKAKFNYEMFTRLRLWRGKLK